MTSTTTPAAAASTAPQRGRRKRKRGSDRSRSEAKLGWMLAGPAFGVMLLVTAYPILQAFYESLFSYRLTAPDDRRFVFLKNYLVILTDGVWWTQFGATVLITVVTVAVELVLGFALAMVMNKAITTIRGPLRTAILIPYAIITVVSAFAWAFGFNVNTGFVNGWIGTDGKDWFAQFGTAIFVICLTEIWKTTPFISLLILSGLAQVPEDLQEAARVDGATFWQRLWRVTIPNMKAAIMVAVLFRTLDAFRIFDAVFIMTNGASGTATLSFGAYAQTISRLEIGLGSAYAVLLFLSVLIICVGFIKFFKVDLAQARGEN